MRFSTSILLVALAAVTSAQKPFVFKTPTSITAGTPINITWTPSTGALDTVTLLLRQGDSTHLSTIVTVAPSILNTGSYLWTPPATLEAGPGYAFEIADDGNPSLTNLSNPFSVISKQTASTASSPLVKMAASRVNVTTGTNATESGTQTGSTPAASATGKSAARTAQVGAGLLAVVGAVMTLL